MSRVRTTLRQIRAGSQTVAAESRGLLGIMDVSAFLLPLPVFSVLSSLFVCAVYDLSWTALISYWFVMNYWSYSLGHVGVMP